MRIIKNGRFIKTGLILSAFTAMTFQSFGTVIDFDSQGLTGPSTFAAANPIPQTIPITVSGITVTFNFGVILTQATNFPANQTSVYGTASFVPGMSNPMIITFSQPVTNFFMNLYNGQVTDATYEVSDNNGNSQNFTLPPNLSSGQSLVGIAATGTIITIEDITGSGSWDFLIDNITFNEPLPPSLVPDGGTTVGLLLMGLTAICVFAKVFAKKTLRTQAIQ
jgi:hypothetical protein